MNEPHDSSGTPPSILGVSVVVPVYQGERILAGLLEELAVLAAGAHTPGGTPFQVVEVLLVNDGAIDGSTEVMQALAMKYSFVRPIWLSRNYGQHPATLAGMASSTGGWIVTMDEDGQHDPGHMGALLDKAFAEGAQLVYANGANPAPHAFWRNLASQAAHALGGLLMGSSTFRDFSSFRLIKGEIARSLAAYCGPGVYLDIALTWVVGHTSYCKVPLREERGRPSGYSFSRLLAHFWRMILTVGTRPLRIIALLGCLSILVSLGITAYVIYAKFAHQVPIQGWTSLIIAISLFSGLILFSLGVIAEYLAMTLTMAMGKPLYLMVSPPPDKRP
ncbi:MAG: glycosyltransferase [Acidobacteria bacterium]|nr:glycosyltransferase [Acidobacteriota bacterium]